MESLKDSVQTSVKIGIFSSEKVSSYTHIFKSEAAYFQISKCRDLVNFNPDRLSKDPYPKEDRPRGQADIDSVSHHRKRIKDCGETEPIFIAVKNGVYTLLDGAHRIVATFLENKRWIPAYLVLAS